MAGDGRVFGFDCLNPDGGKNVCPFLLLYDEREFVLYRTEVLVRIQNLGHMRYILFVVAVTLAFGSGS
jgi:hypothetical protein